MSHREAAELRVKSNILPTEDGGAAVQGSKFKKKQAADYKNFTQICSVAAGSRFKCANARSRFKEKQAADYKNFTQITQSSQIRQQNCR